MPPSDELAAPALVRLITQIKRDLPYDEATAQITAALYAAATAHTKGPTFKPFEIGWTPDLYTLYDILKEALSTHNTKEHNTMTPPTTEEHTKLMNKLLAESREKLCSQKLAQAQADIEWAINATPTGEARNALTLANIFLTHAQDLLAGRPTPVSLDDLAQQVATERYDAAMQPAYESRTT
jgi:hypothetical protein